MQIQTVFRAGNSDVVAVPKSLGKELGIKTGQKVIIDKEGDKVTIQKLSSRKPEQASGDREFKRWWKEFLKENAGILDELAVR
ncbi:MAG: AbrB/MazE/SpoVT family DNA-binding domain-containing protein [Patescibacteria group bacterium]